MLWFDHSEICELFMYAKKKQKNLFLNKQVTRVTKMEMNSYESDFLDCMTSISYFLGGD